jgi:FtsK/SpoIIIE family.
MDGRGSWESLAGGVIATVGPLVAAGIGQAVDVPAWAPAVPAVGVVAGMAVRDWLVRRPWSERAFRLAAGLGAGAWAVWSTITGPWQVANLVVGGALAGAGWLVAPAFTAGEDERPAVAPVAPARPTEPVGRRAQWKSLIERICRVQPITITADIDWPTGTGFTLHVEFAPGSGDTWTAIRDNAVRLAGAAQPRLPRGCMISVEEGDLQGTAVVRVPTVYALAEDVPLPDDTSPLSIWDDLPIGRNEDATTATVNLRQASALVAGRRGGGKSNVLKVLVGQLLRCQDTVVWIADLNGGGLAVPFVLPYAEGEVQTPPIDWVAATADEVVLMARVAVAIAKDRKSRYAGLTARAGGDLLPVTRDLPQITIVVDESAEVEGDPTARAAMDALRTVQRIGRAEAVNVIFSALRATMDTIPVSVRKQAALKLCGPVEDDTELEYMLPGSRVRSTDLVHPGTFYLRRGDQGAAVRQIKVYRTLPAQIRRLVVATDGQRTQLDPAGQQVGGQVYAERWQRLQPWLDRLAGRPTAAPEPADVLSVPAYGHPDVIAAIHDAGRLLDRATAAEQQARQAQQPEDRPLSREEREERRRRAREGLRRAAVRAEMESMPTDRLNSVFEEIVSGLFEDRPLSRPEPGESSGWRPELLIDLARESGPEGIGPTEMQRVLGSRGIEVSMKTINKWVGKYAAEGKLRRLEGGRYKA